LRLKVPAVVMRTLRRSVATPSVRDWPQSRETVANDIEAPVPAMGQPGCWSPRDHCRPPIQGL